MYWRRTDIYGADVWSAQVKLGQRKRTLLQSTDKRACVRAVAEWYAKQFGPNWADLARSNARRRNPWRVWYSAMYRGWIAWVWIRGRPVELRPLTKGRWRPIPPGMHWRTPWTKGELPRPRANAGPLVFPSADAARRAIWPWVERQYPVSAREVVFITEAV